MSLKSFALGLPLTLLASLAFADIEEVTFTAAGEPSDQAPSPGGPAPVQVSGTFFFDTTQFTGGLLPVFQRPGSPPGSAGTAEVFFKGIPGGTLTATYADGSVLTTPFSSPFALLGDFEAPVCGSFDDCFYSVGTVLTLNQFKASPDPWAQIFNGMEGGFGELLSLPVNALPPGTGTWQVVGGGSFEVHSVPEPDILELLGMGLAALALGEHRRKKAFRNLSAARARWSR